MSEISKKVAYIKGMAEGMELKADSAKDKLLLQMLEALDLIAEELDTLRDHQEETDRYIDELDSDLGDLEETVFGEDEDDEDEDGCSCGCHEDEEDEEDDDVPEDSLDFIEYECPHCGASVYYDQNAFDLSEAHPCPSCGKELFPESPDED